MSTSVRRRFFGSNQASNALDPAWILDRFGPNAKCPKRVKSGNPALSGRCLLCMR